MTHVLLGEWTPNDVAVLKVSANEWHVNDLRKSDSDALARLGRIERRDGSFLVTDAQRATAVIQARPPQFASLGGAVLFIEELCRRIDAV
jgi:hypothetical protein